ncbi:helix-turn-helix domain-containing protein [Sphaerisporangium dianthi]|uniref:Helix-turn-helix domain-containing protein n=1 Tax=Sphaerisporangium dianthi TaxID=1436120 RepID=A0ABV9CIC2_9ACTN
MSQTGEYEQFAARLRVLKDRSGMSFEVLATRTGISRSSLHRYCSGTKLPAGYGVVHAFGKACGASNEELRELHRLWAVADSARSSSPQAPEEEQQREEEQEADREEEASAPPGGRETASRGRRVTRRPLWAVVLAMVLVAIGVTAFVILRPGGGEPGRPTIVASTGTSVTAAPVRVFNIEGDCRTRDRVPACSMGLAIDPRKKYAAGNVVAHRVWHGDVLVADCVLFEGDRVEDETGVGTTRWFRVRLDDVPQGHGWLPAVRTHDNPALPVCG